MCGRSSQSLEARSASHLLLRQCAIFPPEPLSTLLYSMPQKAALYELFSTGHWVLRGPSQQEALGVISKEGWGMRCGVILLGPFPAGRPCALCHSSGEAALPCASTSRFWSFLLPLGSSGLGIVRISILASRTVLSRMTLCPRLVNIF